MLQVLTSFPVVFSGASRKAIFFLLNILMKKLEALFKDAFPTINRGKNHSFHIIPFLTYLKKKRVRRKMSRTDCLLVPELWEALVGSTGTALFFLYCNSFSLMLMQVVPS